MRAQEKQVTQRIPKSSNQIVFNPAMQIHADHTDIPEGQTVSTGKKLVRKVKKGTSSGVNKSEANQMGINASGTVNFNGGAAQHSKPSTSAFGHASGMSSSRVVSGSITHSTGATKTLKNYQSTQNLSKTSLNNLRLKQLVQMQSKVIAGIGPVHQKP